MSEVRHQKMESHVNNVTNLKKNFLEQYQSGNESAVQGIIEKMRTIHGCAIYDNHICLLEIDKMEADKVSDDVWIKLSANASLLYVIHSCIRHCEKLAYVHKLSKSSQQHLASTLLTTETEGKSPVPLTKSSFQSALASNKLGNSALASSKPGNATFKDLGNGNLELSIRDMTTEQSNSNYLTSPMPEHLFEQQGGFADSMIFTENTVGLTDFIDNLTTTEANKMFSEYGEKQTGGQSKQLNGGQFKQLDINKPTIINFWADWCGFSQKFKPQWEQFKEMIATRYPDIQVTDLNVGQNESLNAIATKAGVQGFPTVVMFCNGKKYDLVSGNKTAVNILDFVESIINPKRA